MKFSILQQDIMPILNSASRSVGMKAQLPVLGNILIEAESGSLKVSATNLEVGVVRTIKTEVIEEGAVSVPARTLVDLVSNLQGEKIEFTANSNLMEIKTPTFSSTINGIDSSEFPAIPLSGKETALVKADTLHSCLPQVSFASALDEGRPVLTGVLTEIKDKKLQFVATDGYRLAHKVVEIDEDSSFKALVPRRTLEEILRLISEEKPLQVNISTSDNQNQIIFSFGNTKLSSRLIEGQFPSWEKIIPTDKKTTVNFDRNELLKAVKLASVFARGEANVIKFFVGNQGITLTSETKELGGQKKEISAKVLGEEIQIAFNAKFLMDVLGAFPDSEVEMQLSGSLSAVLVRPLQDSSLEYIIMPINLS